MSTLQRAVLRHGEVTHATAAYLAAWAARDPRGCAAYMRERSEYVELCGRIAFNSAPGAVTWDRITTGWEGNS